jgi:hypothetical protein
MSADEVRQAFLDQAKYCDALGSPFTARICRLHAERLETGGAVADLILNWPGNPSSSADSVPLRIAGCLHALVLEGTDSLLSIAYPPARSDDDALWAAVVRAFEAHADFILERLKSAPQTNEVRRSGALLPGFLTLAQTFGKPLVVSEVGASAGLNLQWDRYRYTLGDTAWGDPDSPVLISPECRVPSLTSEVAPAATSIPSMRPTRSNGCACSPISGPTRPIASPAPAARSISPPGISCISKGPMPSIG